MVFRARSSTVLVYAAMAVFLLICGGSLFEHAALASAWAKNPPASLQMFHGDYGVAPQIFFRIAHPILILLLLGALGSSWKNRERRNLLGVVSAGYVVALVATGLYFVPELKAVLLEIPAIPDDELRTRVLTWEHLAAVRTIGMLLLTIPLVRATRVPAV